MFACRLRSSIAGSIALAAVFFALPAAAHACNAVTALDLTKQRDAGEAPLIVDVQNERDFARGHLPEAISTKAFPMSTFQQKEQLEPVVAQILGSTQRVVIVCPGGAEAAENACRYLKEQGVPEQLMAILQGGRSRYPYFDVVRDQP